MQNRSLVWVRALVAPVLAALAIGMTAPARAQTEMIITSELAPTHWKSKQMDALAADIVKRSEGRINAKVFHAAQLYDDKGAINAMGTGSVHMAWPASIWLEAIEPRYGVVNLLFGLRDESMLDKAIREPLKDYLSTLVEKKGMRVLALYRTTELALLSNRDPVASLSELRGMKVRVPGGGAMREFSSGIGIRAVTLPASEIAPALMQGVIDGAFSSPGVWRQFGPKVSMTRLPGLLLAHYSVLVDSAWLDKLQPRDRDAILAAVSALDERQWREAKAAEQEPIDEMVKKGAKYAVLPAPALKEMEKVAVKANAEFIRKFPEAYKKYTNILSKQK